MIFLRLLQVWGCYKALGRLLRTAAAAPLPGGTKEGHTLLGHGSPERPRRRRCRFRQVEEQSTAEAFSRMRSEGFSLNSGGLGVEPCSRRVVVSFAVVRGGAAIGERLWRGVWMEA